MRCFSYSADRQTKAVASEVGGVTSMGADKVSGAGGDDVVVASGAGVKGEAAGMESGGMVELAAAGKVGAEVFGCREADLVKMSYMPWSVGQWLP